jgi:hypothetical protein
MANDIETTQLKKLIADHSVRENLKALTKQNQLISDLSFTFVRAVLIISSGGMRANLGRKRWGIGYSN